MFLLVLPDRDIEGAQEVVVYLVQSSTYCDVSLTWDRYEHLLELRQKEMCFFFFFFGLVFICARAL